MIRTHDGSHGPECFGCKVQSVNFDPFAMPSRLTGKPPRTPNPAWERGIPTDSRGMPFLRPDGSPMGIKEFTEKRHSIEEHRRELHQTNPIDHTGGD